MKDEKATDGRRMEKFYTFVVHVNRKVIVFKQIRVIKCLPCQMAATPISQGESVVNKGCVRKREQQFNIDK